MVKIEKMKNGFIIEMDGASGEVIEEIAQAAAAYHVRTIKEFRKDREIYDESAIKGSVFMFGIMMAAAMRKQLGADGKEEKPVDADFKAIPFDIVRKKGGEVQ